MSLSKIRKSKAYHTDDKECNASDSIKSSPLLLMHVVIKLLHEDSPFPDNPAPLGLLQLSIFVYFLYLGCGKVDFG